ncbi:twin-arginine translocation signal domain-containing protein [Halovivax sp.]|uniref:twin-arginine translocation signal domain-containing protein n=1 Tax=Halovivax sp. TaxID=1935978 RepID=UPI0025BE20D5|nr:twin-arginine translocation signal domain-containing protein [Halovivax sp.]
MTRNNPVSRRTALKLTGAAASVAVLAGCSGNGADADDTNGDGGNGGGDEFEIAAGESILLEGITGGWEGADGDYEGVQNPTFVLEDGEDYEIGWVQGDGGSHNVELWDENEEMVDGYGTDLTDDPGDDGDFLEFTATDEIAYYRCNPHPDMQGEIRVE